MPTVAAELVSPLALRAAFETAVHSALRQVQQTHSPRRRDRSRDISRIVETIHERLFDPLLNVQSIKTWCGIQDNNVSSRFKYEVGVSIKDYIDALRIETARVLLAGTSCSIFEVGQAVGYAYPQTFYRAFYRNCGSTPGMVRATQNRQCHENV